MSKPNSTHPKLRTPLIQEALLELRYTQPSSLPYVLVPGRLYEFLGARFPVTEELPTAQFPIEITEHLVRHRFKTAEGTEMFQVGAGVISINTTAYEGFELFISSCEQVIVAADKIGLLPIVSRIGLRYINNAQLDRPVAEIISIVVQAPELISSALIGQHVRLLTQKLNVGTLVVSAAWPITNETTKAQTVVLDLDMYSEPGRRMKVRELMRWVHTAHDHIYAVFESSLQPTYFQTLQTEVHHANGSGNE